LRCNLLKILALLPQKLYNIIMERPHAEYYQVHRLRLEAIAAKIAGYLATAPDPVVATMEPGDESVFLAAGAETPDTIMEQYRKNDMNYQKSYR
jgi:hypothetical protein